jgi:hypothetical protein
MNPELLKTSIMYNHYDGRLQEGEWVAAREILTSTTIAAPSFGTVAILIVGIISISKRQFSEQWV